jgi:cyclopropane fatty-acyl-phospholipid synthase-like methyltransferase
LIVEDMADDAAMKALADAQRQHWQGTYIAHPRMYGEQPSTPALHAAEVFRRVGATHVLELGAGHGRDALFFAKEGFAVHAMDYSGEGLSQLQAAARERGIADRVGTTVHDVARSAADRGLIGGRRLRAYAALYGLVHQADPGNRR